MSTTELKQNSIKVPTGTTAERPGSPATGDIRFNTTTTKYEAYDGTAWSALAYEPDGSSAAKAATSAAAIKALTGTTTDGLYYIKINGTPYQVYCDMNRDGGGWMATFRCKNYQRGDGVYCSNGTWDFPLILGAGGSTPPTSVTGNLSGATDGLSPSNRAALWASASCTTARVTVGTGSTINIDGKWTGTQPDSSNMMLYGATGTAVGGTGSGYSNGNLGAGFYVYANNYGMGNGPYNMYSDGYYGCNCCEGYYINGDWSSSSGYQIFGDGYNTNGGNTTINVWTTFWIK